MENENELAIFQLKADLLSQQSDEIKASQRQMSERFNAMGKFVKEGFEKLQQQPVPKVCMVYPNKSEQIGELSKAMASAKAEIGSISKGGMANRGKFATLDDMFEVCDPIMDKFELSTTFGISTNEHEDFVLIMILSHSSGQWIENRALLKENKRGAGDYHQTLGAAEKYLRRYMYRAMLNLSENGD